MRASLAALGAIAAAAGVSAVHHPHHAQGRPSLNFGGTTARRVSAYNHDSDAISAFNSQFSYANSPDLVTLASLQSGEHAATARGIAIAETFLQSLHSKQQFRLQSTTSSAAGSVIHAHFVQTLHGKDIVDALVNVNVDVLTGAVVSFGDSAFVPTSSLACERRAIGGLASSVSQFVFGNAPSFGGKACVMSADEATPDQHVPIDPRVALANFILHADPRLVASFSSTDELVDQMTISQSLHAEAGVTQITIHNAPGAIAESGVPAKLAYVQREGVDQVALVWSFEYEMNDNWYEAHVSADTNAEDVTTPLMVVDWQRDAPTSSASAKPSTPATDYTYRVYPWGVNDPTEGKRELLKNPAHKDASPVGWHSVPYGAGRSSGHHGSTSSATKHNEDDEALYAPGWSSDLDKGATFKDTRGNNVFAQDNPSGGTQFETNYRPQSDHGSFDFKLGWGPKANRTGHQIEPASYINASITELFYTCNEIHDLFHGYGFDEASGNFQEHNFGKGGLGGDAVVAMAQDGSGMNNANFATPPDGQRPRMRMYSWSTNIPYADGDLEAGIVIHEYAHGISTRLTGGPANSGCLGWGEAGGMGEGYGDFFATMIRMASADVRDFTMGEWAAHRENGIRKFPYSTNMTHNPSTYKTLDQPGYWGVHAIGEVMAVMLFEMAESLIEKHGFVKDLFPPSANSTNFDTFYATSDKTGRSYPRHGNAYAIQLVVDAFKAQKCRPSFQDHRNAILKADELYTGGENYCTIWKAFSKRGLGPDATLTGGTPWGGGIRTNDFTIPKKCVGNA